MSAWPTEAAATQAVEAAAKAAYDADVKQRREVFPPGVEFTEWDDLEPTAKLAVREAVLPLVWAALSALPDPRRAAWFAGYDHAEIIGIRDDNPYEG